VGIDEGKTVHEQRELLLGVAKFLQDMGVAAKAAVLSGGADGGHGAGASG